MRVPARRPEAIQDAPNPSDNISGVEEMTRILHEFCDLVLGPCRSYALTATDLLKTTGSGRDHTPDYDLRVIELRFTESGFVGKVPAQALRFNCGMNYDGTMADLRNEQPNADWHPVAMDLDVRRLSESEAPSTPIGSYDRDAPEVLDPLTAWTQTGLNQESAREAHKRTVSNPTRYYAKDTGRRMFLRIAVANLSQGELVDPWAEQNEGKAGKMAQYLKTKFIRSLPTRPWREQRVKAEDIIRRFYEENGEQVQLEEEAPADLADPAVLEAAWHRHNDDGVRWAEIAAHLGHPWQRVRTKVANWRAGGEAA